jgi:Nitrogen permease regulator 2
VSFHVDGILNARQISHKAEVDLEMVLACLRVLRQHGVVAIVDMFFYSNRYECTDRASNLLLCSSADANINDTRKLHHPTLLQQAVDYIIIDKERDSKEHQQASPLLTSLGGGGLDGSISFSPNHHNYGSLSNFVYHPNGIDCFGSRSSYSSGSYQGFGPGSFRFHHNLAVTSAANPTIRDVPTFVPHKRKDYEEISTSLMELYCACQRGTSIGELLIGLVSSSTCNPHVKSVSHSFGTDKVINWKKICSLIDHRKFAIFGIVHGLLKRVHNYPLFINENPEENNKPNKMNDNNDVPFSPGRITNQTISENLPLSPLSSSNNSKTKQFQISSATFSRMKRKKSLRYGGSGEDHKHLEEANRKTLQENIIGMLNGLHCDDELVSHFNIPLSSLFEIATNQKKDNVNDDQTKQQSTANSNRRIVSVYSIACSQENMSA